MIVNREETVDRLVRLMGNGNVKVITGIRDGNGREARARDIAASQDGRFVPEDCRHWGLSGPMDRRKWRRPCGSNSVPPRQGID